MQYLPASIYKPGKMMNTTDLRLELKKMIDNESDTQTLKAIKTLLKKSTPDPILKEKLSSRALKSEENIKEGKTFGRKDFGKKLQERFDY